MPTAIDINTGTITLPGSVANTIIQKLQEESAVMRLAQYMDLPGLGATIPVITGDPEANWVAETGKKPVSRPTLATKQMAAYTLAVIVPFSNQFKRNVPALYNAIVQRIPRALGHKFDKTCFGNVQAPGDKFDTFASCTAQSLSGSGGAWGALVDADADIGENNGITNGFVIAPQGKSILLHEVDGEGRPIFVNNVAEGAVPMILGCPTMLSKAAYKAGTPATDDDPAVPGIVGVAGDWTQAIYGVAQSLELSISDQATLVDSDESVINLWQQNMFAVRAEIEIGFRADTDCFNLLTE